LAERDCDCDLVSALAFPPEDDFPALPATRIRGQHTFSGELPKIYLFHSKGAISQKDTPYFCTKMRTIFNSQNVPSKRTQE